MGDFAVGDLVTGSVFGYAQGEIVAVGRVNGIDAVGDPKVQIESFVTSYRDGWEVDHQVFLDRGTVQRISEATDPGPLSVRAKTLREAERLITGDRNQTYGEPIDNFRDIAEVWSTYLRHKIRDDTVIDPGDVAWMMIAVKMVRAKASPTIDNWVDAAGYAGCGSEADTAEGKI